ncbi:porin family protein [Chitinophaga sp.]|uniref:porin family protein n=1 Tax=Chitinophaga sp. TaxID=1869181 RepID=UPI002F927E1D
MKIRPVLKYLLPYIIPACAVFSVLPTFAQNKPFTFGVNAGLNISNAYEGANYILAPKKSKPGFQAGFNIDYAVSDNFYLRSGLSLTTKGVIHEKTDIWIGGSNPPVTYSKTTTRETYLQLPLLIGYQYHITPAYRLFAQAGPYFAYGIGGKEITESKTIHQSEEIDNKKVSTDTFGEKGTGLSRTDCGLGGGLGVGYKRIALMISYELGLVNLAPDKEPGTTSSVRFYKNRNLSITVGYRL